MADDRTVRRLLVFHAGALGDCVLVLHWIDVVRRGWGVRHVCLVARSPIAAWAARRGIITEARSLDSIGAHRLFDPATPLPGDLDRFVRSFDRVVSFLGGPREGVSARLGAIAGEALTAIDPRPTEATLRDGTHIVRQWLAEAGIAEPAGAVGPTLRVAASPDERRGAREALVRRLGHGGLPDPRIALVHPGSGGLDKCCPIEAMEAVVRALADRGFAAGWMIGPDEVERFGGELPARLERLAPVVFEENIAVAADLLLGADVYVGNDAGMTHVAALCGARTIALFGPTDPRVWRPPGDGCHAVGFPNANEHLAVWVQETVGRAGNRFIGATEPPGSG